MENHRILLINDMPGYGKVALSAMIPVLSHMGFDLYNLPTALVSNTLDYGRFDILDTTEYMGNTVRIWEELGFSFDCICTGFIVSEKQAELIAEYCASQKRKNGAKVFVDPIMGCLLYTSGDAELQYWVRRLQPEKFWLDSLTELYYRTVREIRRRTRK